MFSQTIADAICARLAEGVSLRQACRDVPEAKLQTILDWCESNPQFGVQYASARARGYQQLADEILEISDDSTGDVEVDDDGNERTNAERVARSRLRVDSRKWMLSKMLPKVYGDKIDVNHGGRIVHAAELPDDELARIAAGGST